jgi:ATP-dependent exoDNAse (exonuclease V) beta subunit
MDMLKSKNPHPRDSRISFVDETHTYYIDGSSNGYISSTTLIHTLFPKFDADLIIGKMMKSKNWRRSLYFGMTPDQIKEKWEKNRDSAAEQGTRMHENLEKYYNGVDHETNSKEFKMFKKYCNDHKSLEPFRTEWEIFDEDALIAGSVDMIYKDPNNPGSIIIADWKRSKEIKMDNRWQKGTDGLTRNMDDCNFNHYSLQLALYKNILEKKYNQKVSETFLVILHPNQKEYIKLVTRDMDSVVQRIIDRRMGMKVEPVPLWDSLFEFSDDTIVSLKS